MKTINVGIVGYGLSGEIFHAPLIQSLAGMDILKIVSSDPHKVRRKFPDMEVVSSIEDLLSDERIDLVVITTPNSTHYSFAKQSLLAGKHVVVEKPFVIQTEEAKDLIEIANGQNKLLSVFHNRRWDNDFLTVKQCIESGAMGEIYLYEAHFDRYRPEVRERWREQVGPGAGMLYDLGAHLIDQALYLFGNPISVFGDVFAQRVDALVDDYFHIILNYGKMRVILHSGSIVKSSGPKFQVHGSKGSFIKYGLDSQEDALRQGSVPGSPGWGQDHEQWYGELTTENGKHGTTKKIETIPGSYENFYQGIYQAITHNAPLPVNAIEAMNTIKVIELAKKSSLEQKNGFI
ncbi:oxidoreductase [Paenibacillus sp. UMB4589-SE434]|uniref:oxidoreductase n=1 Tax=Paenibacillus sp. UMB4589-SE434 TaxID=3046314 RepID=UPI0025505E7D|nr:oxidoreductase [Paenibacillus sp. UMB4589-SE434]MDK8180100.1 oxidoreductase [Paenibacillus sp. UMB4589-SE434]